MKNKNLKKLIEYPSEGILSKQIFKDDSIEITLFCMAKGGELSEHTTTKEGIVEVIEGRGLFNLQGKEIEMVPGEIIFMKKDVVHSLNAIENTSFLLTLYEQK
jgi:nitric oxide dioxygenase